MNTPDQPQANADQPTPDPHDAPQQPAPTQQQPAPSAQPWSTPDAQQHPQASQYPPAQQQHPQSGQYPSAQQQYPQQQYQPQHSQQQYQPQHPQQPQQPQHPQYAGATLDPQAPWQQWPSAGTGTVPPQSFRPQAEQSSRGPWIAAIAGAAVVALVVGGAAGIFGGLALAGGTAGQADAYGASSDGDIGSWFGADAAYGDYLWPLEFTGVTGVDGLDVGTCFTVDDLDRDGTGTVGAVSCDAEHDEEAYAVTEIGGTEFPGVDEVDAQVYDTCDFAFDDYVGASYDESMADFGGLGPTEQGWADGERSVVCYLYAFDSSRTGSLEGSGF